MADSIRSPVITITAGVKAGNVRRSSCQVRGRKRLRSGKVVGLAAIAACLICLAVAGAGAQSAAARFQFRVHETTLGPALAALAQQAGAQLLYPYDLAGTGGVHSVDGRHTVAEALAMLLRGTGLRGGLTTRGVITITHEPDSGGEGSMSKRLLQRQALALSGISTLALGAMAAPAAATETAQPVEVAQAPAPVQGNVLEEVIVTAARKRSENVQTTPIAVTAISGAMLQHAHVTNFAELTAAAPNLQIIHTASSADATAIYLRGFGTEANQPALDPHVAVFVDGIYQPENEGGMLDMFDISSVEVDGGPQGTLLGKNAPIGAVYVTTEKPTGNFGGEVEGDYGSYDHFGARIKMNVPLIQDADGNSILAGHVSFVEKEGGNWIRDTLNGKTDMGGENSKGARVALAFTPSSAFEWDLTGSFLFQRDPAQGIRNVSSYGAVAGNPSAVTQTAPSICRAFGAAACAPTAYGTTNAIFTNTSPSDLAEVASTMTYRLTPVTLTSVTGFISYWLDNNSDISGTPFNYLTSYNGRQTYDQESEEFRISSVKNGGWDLNGLLDWVVGGYYSNHADSASQNLGVGAPQGVANVRDFQNGTDQSKAVFAHVIFNFTDQWTGTFGVRQSWDDKNHNYQVKQGGPFYYDVPLGFHNTSFEAGTAYQFDPNHMAYFRFAQGYASGGYTGFPSIANGGAPFQEETNNSYEVGFKSDWLNKRLRINFDLFDNEISNLQVTGIRPIPTPPGILVLTDNAGSATVEGVESQIIAVPIENLTTHLNIGYLHPRYNKYFSTVCSNVAAIATDCSGIPFPFAPKWTIDLGGDYAMDLPQNLGTADFSLDWNYRSTLYTSDPAYPSSKQEGYGLVNAGVKYTDPSGLYSVEFYGTNILDRRYKVAVSDAGGLVIETLDGVPAEWGLRVTAKF